MRIGEPIGIHKNPQRLGCPLIRLPDTAGIIPALMEDLRQVLHRRIIICSGAAGVVLRCEDNWGESALIGLGQLRHQNQVGQNKFVQDLPDGIGKEALVRHVPEAWHPRMALSVRS